VARGEVQLGFQQVSEILPVEGATFAGEIPADLQLVTTFSAGVTERAMNAVDAQALVDFLASEAVAGVIASTGLMPVVWE
jgi:molybdate transport system substrate-binding protein